MLDGHSKFVGNEKKMRSAKDNGSAGYRNELRYIYAGRIRIAGRWWRPVARVTSFGEEDANHATRECGPMPAGFGSETKAAKERWTKGRVSFYAAAGEIVMDTGKGPVIFEPCGEPPFWWKPNVTPSEALADAEAAGRPLDERGFLGARDDDDESVWTARAARIKREEDAAERELRDQEDAAREAAYAAQLAEYTAKIREQAGSDTFELTTASGRVLTVPRAPFENWALRRTSLRHLAPEWVPVCPSGLKLAMDDEYHSDWMLGAGLDLYSDYNDDEIRRAAYDAMFNLQRQLGEFEAGVILPGRGVPITGAVGELIAVVPNLDQEQMPRALGAAAIVTETGGALAHLSLFAIERQIPIFLVPDAVHRFPAGTKVTLDPTNGGVTVHVERR